MVLSDEIVNTEKDIRYDRIHLPFKTDEWKCYEDFGYYFTINYSELQ